MSKRACAVLLILGTTGCSTVLRDRPARVHRAADECHNTAPWVDVALATTPLVVGLAQAENTRSDSAAGVALSLLLLATPGFVLSARRGFREAKTCEAERAASVRTAPPDTNQLEHTLREIGAAAIEAARDGDCARAVGFDAQVARIDTHYERTRVAIDPGVSACLWAAQRDGARPSRP